MEPVSGAIRLIEWRWFGAAAVLFFAGMALGPVVYRRQIGWLMAYPRRMARLLERMLRRHRSFGPLFLGIFLINSTSVVAEFLSGFGVVLPAVMIAWTGLNMALVASEISGGPLPWSRLLNFLALFELPAAWAMTAAGMQLGMAVAGQGPLTVATALAHGWRIFLLFSWPLLFVSAVLEAGLIAVANRRAEIDGNGRLHSPADLLAPTDRPDSSRSDPRSDG